jgi:hypothetical protein
MSDQEKREEAKGQIAQIAADLDMSLVAVSRFCCAALRWDWPGDAWIIHYQEEHGAYSVMNVLSLFDLDDNDWVMILGYFRALVDTNRGVLQRVRGTVRWML